MDRRRFCKTSTGLALGGLAWMQVGCAADRASPEFPDADRLTAIGLQLYTVRTLLQDDFEGTLQSVAEIGYDEVEFAGYYDRSPSEVRDLLDELGLVAPATHIQLGQLRNDLDAVIETAQTIGHEYVICPFLPEEERSSIEGYREIARFFNEVGAQMQEAGLRFGYHNHAFEFEPIDDRIPYDVLLQETDPERVTMELDLFWIVEAGHDPLVYFEQYSRRFALCHVKDRTSDGEMVAVGEGEIDFAAIFARSKQAGFQNYIVEYDNPEDPLADLRTSYEHVSALRF